MKHKTSQLDGVLLDAAVAMAEGDKLPDYWLDPDDGTPWLRPGREEWHPSERWDQGGPLIERERIRLEPGARDTGNWLAFSDGHSVFMIAPTPLIAAMRAYVASKLGEEVELP